MVRLWLLLALLAVLGCATGLGNPMVVNTGIAEAPDGYEAALATVESQGYIVADKDRQRHHLRVLAKPTSAGDSKATYFDIQAMPGAVGIFLQTAGRRAPEQPEARALRHQMEQLAWGIGERTLAREPKSPGNFPDPLLPALQSAP